MRVIYFNARGSRHILGGDFRLFQSGSHLSFLRHIWDNRSRGRRGKNIFELSRIPLEVASRVSLT